MPGTHLEPLQSLPHQQPPVSAEGSRWRVPSPNTSPLPSHPVRNCLGVPCTQLSPHLLVSRLPPSCWPGLLYVPRVSRAPSRCLPFACAVPSFWNSFLRALPSYILETSTHQSPFLNSSVEALPPQAPWPHLPAHSSPRVLLSRHLADQFPFTACLQAAGKPQQGTASAST